VRRWSLTKRAHRRTGSPAHRTPARAFARFCPRRRLAVLCLLPALAACDSNSLQTPIARPPFATARSAAAIAQPGDATGERRASPPAEPDRSRVDRAIATWSRTTERHARDDGAWTELGNAFMQKARETLDAGYYARAEQAYARALALAPRNPDAIAGMAWVHGGRHEFAASIEWADKALAIDAGNADAHGLIGDAAVELGDYAQAGAHYRAMMDLRPDLGSLSRTAHLLHLTGNARVAIRLMLQAIDSGGPYAENTAWCRAALARMYLDTGNLVAAEQLAQDALARTPRNPQVLAAAGRVRAARGDVAGAIEAYRQSAALAPQHDVVVALGDLYRAQGQVREAEEQYALVEAIDRLNRQSGVAGDLQAAQFRCEHDRQLADALRMAESAYAAAGDRPAAQRYLSQALSLNPNFSPLAAPQAVALLAQLGTDGGRRAVGAGGGGR
jgi:tetratricopeptide (TPR) repeat protein